MCEESFEAGDGESEVVTTNGVANMTIKEGDATISRGKNLIRGFYSTKLSHPAHVDTLPMPRISHVGGGGSGRLTLQPPRDSTAHRRV